MHSSQRHSPGQDPSYQEELAHILSNLRDDGGKVPRNPESALAAAVCSPGVYALLQSIATDQSAVLRAIKEINEYLSSKGGTAKLSPQQVDALSRTLTSHILNGTDPQSIALMHDPYIKNIAKRLGALENSFGELIGKIEGVTELTERVLKDLEKASKDHAECIRKMTVALMLLLTASGFFIVPSTLLYFAARNITRVQATVSYMMSGACGAAGSYAFMSAPSPAACEEERIKEMVKLKSELNAIYKMLQSLRA